MVVVGGAPWWWWGGTLVVVERTGMAQLNHTLQYIATGHTIPMNVTRLTQLKNFLQTHSLTRPFVERI